MEHRVDESLFPQDGPGADDGVGRPRVYRVAELTRRIRTVLEDEFSDVWIEGEISNLRQPRSGHLYFTLKDDQAQIDAVLFRGAQRSLTFRPADGQKVIARGQISVYEPQGRYQVIVRRLKPAGKGDLQEAFERLKRTLAGEGLFEAARKKPMPMLPLCIGVVTSPTGAAIRDILQVLKRRFPNLHVIIAPVRVQGDGAAAEIAAAIDLFNAMNQAEVLIVGRGGGSLEDLWCFNEEVVARAVARSHIPVISAVGHEIDFTICDLVADLRAPTPSAAAELVVGRKEAFERALGETTHRLALSLRTRLLEQRNRLTMLARHDIFREPTALARQYRERLRGLQPRLIRSARTLWQSAAQQVDDASTALARGADRVPKDRRRAIEALAGRLRALGPLAVLERGFSITSDADGHILRDTRGLAPGALLHTRLARGTLTSVTRTLEPAPDSPER